MSVKDKAIEKIEEISVRLEAHKELLEQLQDIEMIWDNLDWQNWQEPHHFSIELPRVMASIEYEIQRIEDRLERV